MRRLTLSASALALLAIASGDALAKPAIPASVGGPPPGFVTMDRGDARSFLDASLATSFFEGDGPDLNLRAELYYQYVPQGSDTGGYVGVAMSHLAVDDESGTAFSNVELGALHNLKLDPKTSLVLRGGITLPTAPDFDTTDFVKAFANFANSTARFTDTATIVPETTVLRVAVSPVHRSGNIFVRGDAGLDIPINQPDGADSDPLGRINVGVGILAGKTSVTAEFVTLTTTGSVDDGEDRFLHTLALGGRFELPSMQLFGAAVVPVGDFADSLGVDFSLVAGARIPL
jgi:hypothetical protein